MNRYFLMISLLIFGAGNAFALETFVFKDKSKLYDVKVSFEKCENDSQGDRPVLNCNDKATFYILKKNQTQVLQTIEMSETMLQIEGKKVKKGDVTELYGEENYGVVFEDYNFDGIEDLYISNGPYRPYGGMTGDVFLFSKTKGKFVEDEELSQLEAENMIVDIKKKLGYIETFTKSGCCWHQKARYRFVKNRLQKFYVFTEDVLDTGKFVELTTERLIGGKWRKTVKKVLTEKYYKN